VLENTNIESSNQKFEQKQNDLYFYTQSWVWRAIEALVLAKDFDPSPRAISTRLNISVEMAVDALDGLERLGSIERSGKTFTRPAALHNITPAQATKEQLLDAHTNIAGQLLTKLNTESLFTTQICLGSLELVKKHASKISEFLNALDVEGRNIDNPDVISVEISIACINNKSQLNTGVHNA
jgi:DNA-binding MarR family transcriptional regulator